LSAGLLGALFGKAGANVMYKVLHAAAYAI
jgi:hypothetical protein